MKQLLCVMFLLSSSNFSYAAPPETPKRNAMCIQPYAANPAYWQYDGKLTVLLGGSVEDNLFQIPDLEAELELLAASGGNYIRNTLSSRDEGNVWFFKQNADGKYDLNQYNDEYYKRLETMLELTYARGIIVQYEMWDRFDYARDVWERNPFRPVNNVNYSVEESGLKNNYPEHPGNNANPFFRSIPKRDNNQLVLKYQQMHMDRVLELSLNYPNVLYCMDNETRANPEWGAYWSTYIKDKAKEKGVIVQTTEMWDDWDLTADRHRQTFDHPELYSFIDTSQNNQKKGQVHWDNLQWVRKYLKENNLVRPINHVKDYGADGGHFGDDQDAVERFWRTLVGGGASIRFHRPTHGLGLNAKAQANIKSARQFADHFDLTNAAPGNDPAIITEFESNEAFLSRIPGKRIAVYFPRKGAVNISLPDGEKATKLRWLNIDASTLGDKEPVSKTAFPLTTPGDGQWLALVYIK